LTYFGPKDLVRPDALPMFEQTGKYIIEPKIDGYFSELTIGSPNKFISKNDNPIGKNLLGGLEFLSFPVELIGSKFLCEIETGTKWATKRNEDRGYTIIWLHSIRQLNNKLYQGVPYDQNKQKLQEVYNGFDSELKKRVHLGPWESANFLETYRRYQKDICWEGAVLKDISVGLIGANGQGKTHYWKKVKDFPYR
jgi:hypothetical protein